MKVFTKQIEPNGKWYSGCTFKGYDYSESGDTIQEAQGNIRNKLAVMGVEFEEIKWDKPLPYLYRKSDIKPYKWQPPKLDYL